MSRLHSANSNQVGAAGATSMAVVLSRLTTLQYFNLSHNDISQHGGTAIASSLAFCIALTALDISYNKLGDTGAISLIESIAKLSSLKNLNLRGNMLSSDSWTLLFKTLDQDHGFPELVSLNQFDCEALHNSGRVLDEWVEQNGLIIIQESMGFGFERVLDFAAHLASLITLTSLGVSRSNINCVGAIAIAKSLVNLSALTVLNFSQNKIKCEGAKAVATSLANLTRLTYLNLSHNDIGSEGGTFIAKCLMHLTCLETLVIRKTGIDRIPLDTVANVLLSLTDLDCSDCSSLWSPPKEVCSQGGEATVKFIRAVKSSGQFSKSMNLFLIGEGESGKTSLIIALKSDLNQAYHIRCDQRTVGIDISDWTPKGSDINFSIFDLAGQAVYSKTHQFFLLRRALYLFVWRPAQPDAEGQLRVENLERIIQYWLDSLQIRIPGAFVMMVVTHKNDVKREDLDAQTRHVQKIVQKWLSQNADGHDSLHIWGNGESICVDSLAANGGIAELRQSLIEFIQDMPWFREALPSSWIDLKNEIIKLRSDSKGYLEWPEYHNLAVMKCGLDHSALDSATQFLNESGVIRFFGHQQDTSKNTVYISPAWVMNVMKGLLRHERQALLDFVIHKQIKPFLKMVNRLNLFGMLNFSLAGFLWPSKDWSQEATDFWSLMSRRGNRENEIWNGFTAFSKSDIDQALYLLESFDLIKKIKNSNTTESECEFVVPGVLAPSLLMPFTEMHEFPFWITRKYRALPAGGFDACIIRVMKNSVLAVDFTSVFAIFSATDGHIAQLYIGSERSCQTLTLRSSSNEIFEIINKEIVCMEKSFPGIQHTNAPIKASASFDDIKDKFGALLEQTEFIPTLERSNFLDVLQKGTLAWICKHASAASVAAQKSHLQQDVIPCPVCVKLATEGGSVHRFQRSQCLADWVRAGDSTFERITECPNCQNSIRLADLLCKYVVPEIRYCPSCMDGFETPRMPGTFNASECRLKCRDSDQAKETIVTCLKCNSAGRLGIIRVSDLVPPEVFVSGWQTFLDAINVEIRRKVEEESKFAPKDQHGEIHDRISEKAQEEFAESAGNFVRIMEREADIFVEQRSEELPSPWCMFVVLFLSDAYVHSEESRNQIAEACKGGKCLIPILLPVSNVDDFKNHSLGWTGPRADDLQYWEHAKRLCHGKAYESFDWSFLGEFSPLEPDIAKSPESVIEILQTISNLAVTIASLIRSRLHRPGKIDSYLDFSLTGVRLSYFDKFIEACGGREKITNLTTTEVKDQFILAMTGQTKLSLCEQLGAGNEYKGSIGTAEWFYSHAWQFRFLDTVDAAKRFFESKNLSAADPIIWFDIFSVSQYKAELRPFEWWNSIFLNAVGSIGKVLMLMQPFASQTHKLDKIPAWTTLTRVWCVFELYSCVSTSSLFEITMNEDMSDRFLKALQNEETLECMLERLDCSEDCRVLKSLQDIRCEEATAFKLEDRDLVFDVIQKTIGFDSLNSMVLSVMEEWLIREIMSQIAKDNCAKSRLLRVIVTFCDKCLERRNRMKGIGSQHPDTLQCRFRLACLRMQQGSSDLGKIEQGRGELVDCLELRKLVLGKSNPDTLRLMFAIATEFNKYIELREDAGAIHRECLQLREQVLGRDHPDTKESQNAVTNLDNQISQFNGAPSQLRQVASMALYHNTNNPCFSGRSIIKMADGSSKFVGNVQKGDAVLNARGCVAIVACVVATRCDFGFARLVRLGEGLEITPWHPVRAKDGIWRFPCEMETVEVLDCDFVYSFVLEADSQVALHQTGCHSDSGVLVGNIECATLGHGMMDERRWVDTSDWSGICHVICHEYFGSKKIIQDLARLPGWSEGQILVMACHDHACIGLLTLHYCLQFLASCLLRDEDSGRPLSFKRDALVTTAQDLFFTGDPLVPIESWNHCDGISSPASMSV